MKIATLSRFLQIFILIFTSGFFTTHSNAGVSLSLKELIALGLQRTPRVKKVAADLSAAQAETSQVKSQLFPTLNIKGTATEHDDEMYRAYLEASQPLYVGGALTSTLQLRAKTEEMESLNLQKERNAYVRDLISAFMNLNQISLQVSVAQENLSTLKSHYGVIERYEKIGRARKTDKLQTSVNVSTAQADFSDLEDSLFSAREDLRKLLATEELPPIDFENAVQASFKMEKPEKVNSEKVVAEAVQNNYDTRLSGLAQDIVMDQKGVALASDLPQLYLKGQMGYRDTKRDQLFMDSAQFASITLDLTIPFFSGFSSFSKRREYEERYVSATQSHENQKLELTSELRAKLNSLTASYDEFQFAKSAAEESKLALKLATSDYKRSTISNQDLVAVERTWYDAEKLFIRAEFKYASLLLSIRDLTGQNLAELYTK
jgi:outer membrane protein